jgi:hypothetical protein
MTWPAPEPGTHFGWTGTFEPKFGEHPTVDVALRRHGQAAELYAAYHRGYNDGYDDGFAEALADEGW